MKKIIFSLLIICFASAMAIKGTMSFFSDTEISTGNIFTTGTIDIAIDGENPWSQSFVWDDIKPGKSFEINFEIKNVGDNPLKLWKIIKCVRYDENGVIEPEQEWYNENGVEEKNNIDSAIVYEMEVDGQIIISREAGITMDKIKDNYMSLIKDGNEILQPNNSILIVQRYFMKEDTGNWAQSDKMTFIIEIEARQTNAPDPSGEEISCDYKIDIPADTKTASNDDYDDANPAVNSCLDENCDNGLDDDCDGFIDCADSDCDEDLACQDITVETITLLDLNETDQYGYNHNYASATVAFTYVDPSPVSNKLTGSIIASGLKSYATYQVKLKGKPICDIGGADDIANEYVGYKGRWTCVEGVGTCPGNANNRNRTDAQYETNKLLQDGNPDKECIIGYLVFDYFTADANGDIYADDIILSSDSSYHVLRCGGGGCGNTGDDYLYYPNLSHPNLAFCPYDKVNGEVQFGRGGCNRLTLAAGDYNLKMVLTEECFHQRNWATVMGAEINFIISN